MAKYTLNEEFLLRIERLQTVLKNNLTGMFGGGHQAKNFGSSCEFADYRDYMPGDDVSKIDWNAYARFDELFLKLYWDERRMHTKIYIDASRSMDFEGKADRALEVAATLAYLSIVEMDKVSIYAVKGDEVIEVISGMAGRESYFEKIRNLNNIEFGGDCYFSSAILPQPVGYGDGISAVISDFLTDADYEGAIDYMVDKRRDLICVQILSQDEINPQIRGKYHLFDSENAADTFRRNINHDIVSAYKQAVAFTFERIKKYVSTRGGSYVNASLQKPIDEIFFQDLLDEGVLK